MNKLAIISPSYIDSEERYNFAKKSNQSLRDVLGAEYPHFITNDIPFTWKSLFVPNKNSSLAKEIYTNNSFIFERKGKKGSNSAILNCLEEVEKSNIDLVFIHLDDHYYVPKLNELVNYSIDSFANDSELQMIKFSAYPLISDTYDMVKGNKSLITLKDDNIIFDSINLIPKRYPDYTLWWSYFNEQTVDGNFWPIPMWLTIYRTDFLKKLLEFKNVKSLLHLKNVESFYKDKINWSEFISTIKGKFGYINMQFGGTEMQRDKNWRSISTLPNYEIR